MKRLISTFLITIICGGIIYCVYDFIKKKNISLQEDDEIKYIFNVDFATKITSSEIDNLIKNNDLFLLMIGDKESESSAMMSTYLKQIAQDYDLKIYYLEKDINDEDLVKFMDKDESLREYSHFTPVLLVFKDKLFVGAYPGDAKYHNLKRFLEYNGIIKGEIINE